MPSAYVSLLATGMLLTGAFNTIATKYQDQVVVAHDWHGKPITYYHPAFQSACMFLGEFACLIPYCLHEWNKRRKRAQAAANAAAVGPTAAQAAAAVAARHHQVPNGLHGAVTEPLLLPLQHAAAPAPSHSEARSRSDWTNTIFMFALPTLCDATTTTLMNVGLYYTSASAFQMLRGTIVLFAGLLTILILRRRLYLHHWQGMMLIVVGAFIVGMSSVLDDPCSHYHNHGDDPDDYDYDFPPYPADHMPGLLQDQGADGVFGKAQLFSKAFFGRLASMLGLDGSDAHEACQASKNPLLGNVLVMASQVFAALQFIVEERYLKKYHVPALLVVGIEGFWGLILSCVLLPLCQHLQGPNGWPIDDVKHAFSDMLRIPMLQAATLGSVVSMAFFNCFGIAVTKRLSGASRATIDACRTCLVWAFALMLGWEHFSNIQILGFFILLCGTTLYNELLLPVRDAPPHARYPRYDHAGNPLSGQPPGLHGPRRDLRSFYMRQGSADSTGTAYDLARSLRIGRNVLSPHSIGSMGGSAVSLASPISELWGSPSMDQGMMAQAMQGVPGATASGRGTDQPATPRAGAGRASAPALAAQRSGSYRPLPHSGSLYNAFYSGLDVTPTPPHSMGGQRGGLTPHSFGTHPTWKSQEHLSGLVGSARQIAPEQLSRSPVDAPALPPVDPRASTHSAGAAIDISRQSEDSSASHSKGVKSMLAEELAKAHGERRQTRSEPAAALGKESVAAPRPGPEKMTGSQLTSTLSAGIRRATPQSLEFSQQLASAHRTDTEAAEPRQEGSISATSIFASQASESGWPDMFGADDLSPARSSAAISSKQQTGL